MILTPTQQRIVDYLCDQSPQWLSMKDIHKALWPVDADIGNVKVQIHRAIENGAPIISGYVTKQNGRRGYRCGAAS